MHYFAGDPRCKLHLVESWLQTRKNYILSTTVKGSGQWDSRQWVIYCLLQDSG